jgi:hypothetical protein
MKAVPMQPTPLEMVRDMPYSDELKALLFRMLIEDEDSRPDFQQLSHDLTARLPDPQASEKFSKLKNIQDRINTSHEADATIASNLEELWALTLFTKWKLQPLPDFATPQFYQRKVEMQEKLGIHGTGDAADSVNSYPSPYVPITEFVSDITGVVKTLIVEKKLNDGGEFMICNEITQHLGSFCPRDRSQRCIFKVSKDHSTVTIREPATTTPTVLVKLIRGSPIPLLPNAMFRLGTIVLIVTSISRSSLSIELREVNNTGMSRHHTITPDQGSIYIGRKIAPNRLAFVASGLSSDHAKIAWAGKYWTIEDVESKNGIFRYCHTMLTLHRESDEVRLVNGQIVSNDVDFYRFWLRTY